MVTNNLRREISLLAPARVNAGRNGAQEVFTARMLVIDFTPATALAMALVDSRGIGAHGDQHLRGTEIPCPGGR